MLDQYYSAFDGRPINMDIKEIHADAYEVMRQAGVVRSAVPIYTRG